MSCLALRCGRDRHGHRLPTVSYCLCNANLPRHFLRRHYGATIFHQNTAQPMHRRSATPRSVFQRMMDTQRSRTTPANDQVCFHHGYSLVVPATSPCFPSPSFISTPPPNIGVAGRRHLRCQLIFVPLPTWPASLSEARPAFLSRRHRHLRASAVVQQRPVSSSACKI